MKALVNQIALVVFAVLAMATLLLGIFNDKGLIQVRHQFEKLTTVDSAVTKIETDNEALAAEIHALRTDPTAIEKLAREQQGLVKPGEVVLVLPPDPSVPPSEK